MDAVVDVPDPRKARGKRHAWALVLTLIAAALVCGQRSGRAMGQWVAAHGVELMTQLPIPQWPLPSTSTLRRALRAIDVSALEDRLAQFTQGLEPPPNTPASPWHGHALDGKAVRGANVHGAQVHLISLVQHGTGIVRKQGRVPDRSNEITAVPTLLASQAPWEPCSGKELLCHSRPRYTFPAWLDEKTDAGTDACCSFVSLVSGGL